MEGIVRHCMLKFSHDKHREVGIECPECHSKCDYGLFKQRWGLCGVCVILGCGDEVVAMTTLKCIEAEDGSVMHV